MCDSAELFVIGMTYIWPETPNHNFLLIVLNQGVLVRHCYNYHMDLSSATHKAALLKLEAMIYFDSISSKICWIWCGKLTIFSPFLTDFDLFVAGFPHQTRQIRKVAELE